MLNLRKLFSRETAPFAPTVVEATLEEVKEEVQACVLEVMQRAAIERPCFELELMRTGATEDGKHLVVANLRLVKWNRMSGVRLLMGLPLLERAVRRSVAANWVAEACCFEGLWLHASAQILELHLINELVQDLERLEAARPSEELGAIDSDRLGLRDLKRAT